MHSYFEKPSTSVQPLPLSCPQCPRQMCWSGLSLYLSPQHEQIIPSCAQKIVGTLYCTKNKPGLISDGLKAKETVKMPWRPELEPCMYATGHFVLDTEIVYSSVIPISTHKGRNCPFRRAQGRCAETQLAFFTVTPQAGRNTICLEHLPVASGLTRSGRLILGNRTYHHFQGQLEVLGLRPYRVTIKPNCLFRHGGGKIPAKYQQTYLICIQLITLTLVLARYPILCRKSLRGGRFTRAFAVRFSFEVFKQEL